MPLHTACKASAQRTALLREQGIEEEAASAANRVTPDLGGARPPSATKAPKTDVMSSSIFPEESQGRAVMWH